MNDDSKLNLLKCKIDYVEQCIEFEITLHSDISIRNISNAMNDLPIGTNNLMSNFPNANSCTLLLLYNSYCMNVYDF